MEWYEIAIRYAGLHGLCAFVNSMCAGGVFQMDDESRERARWLLAGWAFGPLVSVVWALRLVRGVVRVSTEAVAGLIKDADLPRVLPTRRKELSAGHLALSDHPEDQGAVSMPTED